MVMPPTSISSDLPFSKPRVSSGFSKRFRITSFIASPRGGCPILSPLLGKGGKNYSRPLISSNNLRSSLLNSAPRNKSGRFTSVFCSACLRRQRLISSLLLFHYHWRHGR